MKPKRNSLAAQVGYIYLVTRSPTHCIALRCSPPLEPSRAPRVGVGRRVRRRTKSAQAHLTWLRLTCRVTFLGLSIGVSSSSCQGQAILLIPHHSPQKDSFLIGNLVHQHTPTGYRCPPSQLMKAPHMLSLRRIFISWAPSTAALAY